MIVAAQALSDVTAASPSSGRSIARCSSGSATVLILWRSFMGSYPHASKCRSCAGKFREHGSAGRPHPALRNRDDKPMTTGPTVRDCRLEQIDSVPVKTGCRRTVVGSPRLANPALVRHQTPPATYRHEWVTP